MKKSILRILPFLMFTLTSTAWAEATDVPGKPFDYLYNLAQSSSAPVYIADSTGSQVGTYLGLSLEQTSILLGLTGAVEGEEFSFVVSATANGFDASANVTHVFPYVEGSELDAIAAACGLDTSAWYGYWYSPDACGQALRAYVEVTAPCDQVAMLSIYDRGEHYTVGGLFEPIILDEPGATAYRLNGYELVSPPYPLTNSYGSSMAVFDYDGSCVFKRIPSAGYYSRPIKLYHFDKLGDLYETYLPPFELNVR